MHQPNLGDIGRPDLIRAINDQIPQQVRIDLVRLIRQAEVTLWVLRRKRESIGLVAFSADVTKPHARPCAWGFTEIRTG